MITLVLGGTRSGKSEVAEQLAGRRARHGGRGGTVTYVATGQPADDDMAARIQAHQARRPAAWSTMEAAGPAGLLDALRSVDGIALVDSLGTWLAGSPSLSPDVDGLCQVLTERAADTVIVSDEVGLGVHPSTEIGRRFRDALGLVNQRVAAIADEVLLVVAGRVLRLEEL